MDDLYDDKPVDKEKIKLWYENMESIIHRQRIDGARIANKRILKEIEESGLSQDEYLNLKYGSFAIPEPDDNIHNNDHANNNN